MIYRLNKRTVLLISIFLVIFFVGFSRCMRSAKYLCDTTASVITYPFLRVQNGIAGVFEGIVAKRSNIKNLEKMVESLDQGRMQLLAENIALHTQLDYMQDTYELRRFQERYTTYSKQLVQIVFRQFFDKGHFFIIDAGSKHGIERDMIAVYKNCLIGRVTEVFPLYAKITLIADQSFKVAAFCAKTKTKGIYEGLNSLESGSLAHVSHLEKMENNDLIISSGEGLVFPRGFGLGRVRGFSVNGVNYVIDLEPLVDLQNLSYCYVMKKGEL